MCIRDRRSTDKSYHLRNNVSIPSVIETTCVVLIVFSTAMAGCLDSSDKIFEEEIDWDKNLIYLEDPLTHEDAREFIVGSASTNDTWGESFWAVFGNEEGGNCCEHYLAGTKEGWIVNFGGEYPTWSEDRGHTCLLYTSPSPRDRTRSRMPSSA